MNRSLLWMAGGALMALVAGYAPAGTTTAPVVPKDEGTSIKADQAAPAASGSSVVERDRKRYENQKRAADRRAAEMKKANTAKKPAKPGSSVVERDKKRYEAQKRAADKRAAEMKKAGQNKDGEAPQDPAKPQEQAPATK